MDKKHQIPLARPSIGEAEWEALKEPLDNGWLTSGPKVQEFEQEFAQRHGVHHAIACTSATTALHLALMALGVGEGDEVIVPAFTWVATANAVVYCGATPVFADIDLGTFNLDPEELPDKISERTKAIIPVHLFGLCANMDAIREKAGKIPLVEDAACAVGATYKGKSAGSLGDLGCFSFHPRKVLTTGEGGMVTTNDEALADDIRTRRSHGASLSEEQRHQGAKPYLLPDFEMLGYNYRMTDLQAALGIVQMSKLEEMLKRRRAIAQRYKKAFSELDRFQVPQEQDGVHTYQSFVLLVDHGRASCSRNAMMEQLETQGISVRPGTHSVPTLGYYQKRWGAEPMSCPRALEAHQKSMAIPLYDEMREEDMEEVVEALRSME